MSKIHTTIGLYSNGDYVVNGVHEDHLNDHIKYNTTFRGGRALFVDGACVYTGYMTENQCYEFAAKTAANIKLEECTAPYN